jgi:hypothetical protein
MTQSSRERILNKAREKAKPTPSVLFGEPIHLRRPTIQRVLEIQEKMKEGGEVANNTMIETIIHTVYPVDGDAPMFTDEDIAAIKEWSFDDEVAKLVSDMAIMLGLNIQSAEKNSVATLTDTSS